MTFKVSKVVKAVCPACGTEARIKVGTRPETFVIRKDPIEIQAEVRRCESCGEVFAGVEEEERNFQKAYRVFRTKHALLQPEEIRTIREQYCLGQRAFSLLLGWGEITLHRYESGALQDEAHNAELLLLRDPENFRILFERTKQCLPPLGQRRVEEHLRNLLLKAPETRLREWFKSYFNKAQADITTGYRCFDIKRFENVVLFFCKSIPPITKTKLNKLLWYSDFLTFQKTRQSITGLPYVHLQYGPVPVKYDFYLAHFLAENALASKEVVYGKDAVGEVYSALREADLTIFQEFELQVLKKVARTFRGIPAKRLVELSHAEEGYKATKPGEIISYKWAEKLTIDKTSRA